MFTVFVEINGHYFSESFDSREEAESVAADLEYASTLNATVLDESEGF